ncbi:MAG: hypothetical protein KDD66_07810 [Bdellovibrionales bacterium]|nr:hypothetical protein [Bdellovibrionales bacterium]
MTSRIHSAALVIVPLLLVAFASLFQLSVTNSPMKYAGFTGMKWEIVNQCIAEGGHRLLQPQNASVGTWIFGGGQNTGVCISEPIQSLGEILELDVAGYPSTADDTDVTIDVRFKDDASVHSLKLPETRTSADGTKWYSRWFKIPGMELGREFVVSVQDQASVDEKGWIAVRDRVNFYNLTDKLLPIREALQTVTARATIVALLAVLIVLFTLVTICSNNNRMTLFIGLAFLVFAVHFRLDAYFYWDEWHVLQRFQEQGWKSAVIAHNEHFIPLFFTMYFAEVFLFRDSYVSYLMTSLLLHVINAYLLARLLSRFAPATKYTESAARLSGVMFALSSICSEPVQWAFMQSVLAGTACSLAAFICGWDYVQRGRVRDAVLCCGAIVLGPLFFGGSLAAVLQLAVLVLVLEPAVLADGGRRDVGADYIVVDRKKQLFVVVLVMWAFIATVYLINQDGAGHGLSRKNLHAMFEYPEEIFSFLVVGTQLGAVLGGAGIFPVVDAQPPIPILPDSFLYIKSNAMLLLSVVFGGLLVGVFLLWILIKLLGGISRRETLLLLVGQLMLFASLLLPAVGRGHLGPSQALCMRYIYTALPWFFVFILPFTERLVRSVQGDGSFLHPGRTLASLLIAAYFGSHLFHLSRYDFYTQNGVRNKHFISKSSEWFDLLATDAQIAPGDFTGKGAEFAGLQPVFPPNLAPDFTPGQVYRLLHWLNSEKYPKKKWLYASSP